MQNVVSVLALLLFSAHVFSQSLLPDYQYWKELTFGESEFCGSNFRNWLANDIGMTRTQFDGKYGVLQGHYFPPEQGYRSIYSSNYDTTLSTPIFYCTLGKNIGQMILKAYPGHPVAFEMESNATYFIGDGGPKVEARLAVGWTYFAPKVEILYYSETGWAVAATTVIPDNLPPKRNPRLATYNYDVKATLPYPTLVKLRITPVPGTAPGENRKGMFIPDQIDLHSVSLYTQECAPDVSDPGRCL